jgi:rare lipoprotein A
MMRAILIVFLAFVLSGCTAIELAADFGKKINRGSSERRYKIGDPYKIKGVWYYPERNLNYDETGIASWYGDQFAGKPTANGEIFDPDIVSAAHKTLPMPSAVRVINLENGRSLVVRVNDRGPFVPGRIIDLSREAARLLGFEKNGVARVRVHVLTEASLRLEREAKKGNFPKLGTVSRTKKPRTSAAAVPSVSLNSNSKKRSGGNSVSAIDQISASRTTDVIELGAVKTDIFVQIGAFQERGNAEVVIKRISKLGPSKISTFDDAGRRLHRVRMGPFANINEADRALGSVINIGYSGARIILD